MGLVSRPRLACARGGVGLASLRRYACGGAASLAVAAFGCGAEAFAAPLPDGRGYEIVSPVEKFSNDAGAVVFGSMVGSSWTRDDGDRVLFASEGAFPGSTLGQGNLYGLTYSATRSESGWATTNVSPQSPIPFASQTTGGSVGLAGMSSDASRLVFQVAQDATHAGRLLLQDPDGTITDITAGEPAGPAGDFMFAGGSPSLDRIVFTSPVPLLAGDPYPTGDRRVYEWHDGQLQLLSLRPDGTATHGDGGAGAIPGRFVTLVNPSLNAVSRDALRVYFQPATYETLPDPSAPNALPLYLAENGSVTDVSAAQGVAIPAETENAMFQAATPDGSTVFFISPQQLTPDAPAGVQPTKTWNLYRYDVPTGVLSYLTTYAVNSVKPLSIVSVSTDGSRLYLATTSQLVPGTGTLGQYNLYRWEAGQAHYVGTAATGFFEGYTKYDGVNAPSPAVGTPDGRYLSFVSSRAVTAYNSAGKREVYEYDATTDTTVCVSCRTDGGAPTGDATGGATHPLSATIGATNIASDGEVFFDTPDALVPEDINGVRDVYAYRDGIVSLISAGTGDDASTFLQTTPSGKDAFFLTRDPLVEQDVDGGYRDLYDARVGGGFPAPPQPEAECGGDACHTRGGSAPAGALPSSMTFFAPIDQPRGETPAFTVLPISAAARAKFAKTGTLTLIARVASSGALVATAEARIGKRTVTVARATRVLSQPGTTRLTLRLSTAARRQLSRVRQLRLQIKVGLSQTSQRQVTNVTLRRSRLSSHRSGKEAK